MNYIINTICPVCLLIIAFQDFRERRISWITLPLLFLLLICRALIVNSFAHVMTAIVINAGFILLQLICLTLWFSFRERKWVNVVDTMLGLGDVLFFISIAAAFEPKEYILFYLTGLFLTLSGFLLFRYFKKNAGAEIPLAGVLSVLLLICYGTSAICSIFS